MKFLSCSRRLPSATGWALLFLGAALAGCGRGQIQEYRVAKEQPQAQPQPNGLPPGHPDTSGTAAPRLQYQKPADWQEAPPGEMRAASFRVTGKDGKQADISVIPLPGLAGSDLDNVNRWRGQVGQPPVSEAELAKLAQPVQVAGQPASLYEQAGANAGSGDKSRILAAITRREGVAWFFKMTGDDELVAQQKPVFIEFLKSVAFPAAMAQGQLPPSHPPISPAATMAPPAADSGSGEFRPNWDAPATWKEVPGGQFLVAKFVLPGGGDVPASVNISKSNGDGGGLLANVNRWRGQLGLGPLTEADLAKAVQSLDLPGGKATLADIAGVDGRTGQKARLLAAVVPRSGQTWFYKLMGDEKAVQQEKEAFLKFVQGVKY